MVNKELPGLQTDGNRLYKDMRNYVSAVRGETGSVCSRSRGFVTSAALTESLCSSRHARGLQTPHPVPV